MKQHRTLAVGVTGGIGSGKTEACRVFESFGVRVLYADLIARDLINTHQDIKKKIKRLLGEHVYTPEGQLDRKQVAKLVFYDAHLNEQINAIVHPFVLEEIEKEIQQAKHDNIDRLIMTEAALIFESGGDKMLDYVIVIDAEGTGRIARVMQRDNAPRADILHRIKSQMPVREKIERADFVINNNGDLAALKQKCKFLYNLLCRIAEGN